MTFATIYSTNGPKLLDTLKRKKVSALFALSSDFLKGEDSKQTIRELTKRDHVVGYFYQSAKGQPLSGMSDERIRQELKTIMARFEELHGVKLQYIVFQYPEFQMNPQRLTALAEQEGLTVVAHNLYLNPETEKAKSTILTNVFRLGQGSHSHIAMLEGFSATNAQNIDELDKHAKKSHFKLVSFAACDPTKLVVKDSESFELLSSLECDGNVQARDGHGARVSHSKKRRTFVKEADMRGTKKPATTPVKEGKKPSKGKKATFVKTEDMRHTDDAAVMMKAEIAKPVETSIAGVKSAVVAQPDAAKTDATKKDATKSNDPRKTKSAEGKKTPAPGTKAEDKKNPTDNTKCKDGKDCGKVKDAATKDDGNGAVSLSTTSFALALALISAAIALF